MKTTDNVNSRGVNLNENLKCAANDRSVEVVLLERLRSLRRKRLAMTRRITLISRGLKPSFERSSGLKRSVPEKLRAFPP
jgi:hypothetical protein